uniref:Uncharacterized protein n=1 Tax=Rhizophora mucronata TaxID=61149 RepID=A0A2P2Q765_RHIMU
MFLLHLLKVPAYLACIIPASHPQMLFSRQQLVCIGLHDASRPLN